MSKRSLCLTLSSRTASVVALGIFSSAALFSACSAGSGAAPSSAEREVPLNNSANGSSSQPEEPEETVELTAALAPAAATYGAGAQLDFQLTWAEPLTVAGLPRIQLQVGPQVRYADYVAGSGGASLTFRYTVQAGDSDANGVDAIALQLNGGSLTASVSLLQADLSFSGVMPTLASVLINTSSTPPGAPTQVAIAPTTSASTLSVSWSVPPDNGTAITAYLLQYREQGQSLWNTRSPNPTQNSAALGGLTAGTTYEIRVAAYNGAVGAFSSVQIAQIFDIMQFDPIAWLDGADPAGNGVLPGNGSKLATWVDKTGSAQNATETVAANQPTFQTGVRNGLPAVYFNDHDRGLQGSFTRANGTSLTIFVVGQFDSAQSDRCMFEFVNGSARAFFIDRRYASNTLYSPVLTKGSFQLWRITNSGANAQVVQNTSTSLYNGTLDFNTNFTGTGTYTLGDDSTGGNRLTGYIGEILIFDSALSGSDISQIESYLQTKWGL